MKEKALISWAFYDYANTIFSAVVLTSFFPLYVTSLTGMNWQLGAASTGTMICAGLFTPALGALSDRTGKTKSYLLLTTLTCVTATALLSFVQPVGLLIALFVMAGFFYHASLVFYNSLLVVVAPPEKQGFASGLGTALGYLGVVLTLPFAYWIQVRFGIEKVFAAAAFLFLLFSLPLFRWVPERRSEYVKTLSLKMFKAAWVEILELIKTLPGKPALMLFLGGNFFAVDALNSAIFWISVYTRETFNPGTQNLIIFLVALNASAFVSGIMAGLFTDKIGAGRMMLLSTFALALSLSLMALSTQFEIFIVSALVPGAFSIAGIWTAGRRLLIELAEPEKTGEYFGLYGLTTKISVLGSLLFSVTADLAGYRNALWLLVFPALTGFVMIAWALWLRGKKDPGRTNL